jgi:hypothetical protein
MTIELMGTVDLHSAAQKVVENLAANRAHPAGLYFNLNEQAYRSDSALGSTDMKNLARNPYSFWYRSAMNPKRPKDKGSDAKTRGTAMHVMVLDGEAKFDRRYIRGPDHDDDMTPAEKSASTKAAKKLALGAGKTLLAAVDFDRITEASAMITMNPALKTSFLNGWSEVSVFWERNGVRRKARFDYLKPRGVGDLKSITNVKDIDFKQACHNAIANLDHLVQAAHYLEARSYLADFIRNGAVFGDHGDDSRLQAVADAEVFAFQWIFVAGEGPALTHSKNVTPGSDMLIVPQQKLEKAADTYLRFTEAFNKDDQKLPWVMIEDPTELQNNDMPNWYNYNAV